jgi:hypothetical protein
VALLAGAASAQGQAPLPRGAPDELIARSLKVHVVVDEELDPDRLRGLARPGVAAWVHTRSNTLRDSLLENLARFDEAWVELRGPLSRADAAQFSRAPRVGPWLALDALALAGALPGARRVAVQLSDAALDEGTLERLLRARPAVLAWAPAAPVDLLQWGLFLQAPGRKVLIATAATLLPSSCEGRSPAEPSVEVHVARLLAASSPLFPCGRGARVVVEPDVDRWLVQSLVVRDPSVELVLELGADAERASSARALLEGLGFPPSR